ncbi:MAG: MscL family protein [Bacilli bacterium]|nr:MscL family protein [Bacilli bacterium]
MARGNVLDMAVGVIIGGAFNAIVTALVNILMSVCTWWVPGGIKGLVTVLPAATNAQKGFNEAIGLGQKFQASELQALGTKLAEANYAAQIANDPNYLLNNPNLIEAAKTTILSKYTLHGATYTYNLSAVIDWGTFINAIISFILIAITLFIIIKVANRMAKAREELKAKAAAEAEKLLNKEEKEQE